MKQCRCNDETLGDQGIMRSSVIAHISTGKLAVKITAALTCFYFECVPWKDDLDFLISLYSWMSFCAILGTVQNCLI